MIYLVNLDLTKKGRIKMRELQSASCPNCLEFLGDIDSLDECPICGYELKEKVTKSEEEKDEE